MQSARRRIPALDGLRGLAALAIVVTHGMGWDGFKLGVDVFFVLSGFLITSLLVEELEGTGRLDLGRFYRRRVRRLLPPLLPVLAVGAYLDLVVLHVGGTGPLDTALYVQNLRLAHLAQPPVDVLAHSWSLSIEEHFYLVWPVVLFGAYRWQGLRGALGVAVAGILAVNAVRIALVLTGASETRLYFADETRSDTLLIGCGIALLAQMGRLPPVSSAMALLAAAGLEMAALVGSMGFRPVLAAALLVPAGAAVLIVRLIQQPGGLLASGPLRYLGRISYALYLWHHLPAEVMHAMHVTPGLLQLVVVAAFGLGMAALSDLLIEAPIRQRAGRTPRLSPQPAAIAA